jgi:hypothetical protein
MECQLQILATAGAAFTVVKLSGATSSPHSEQMNTSIEENPGKVLMGAAMRTAGATDEPSWTITNFWNMLASACVTL